MSRPKIKPTNCRNKGVRIRVTENELAQLKEDAARRCMNVSEYIRTLVGMEWKVGDGTGDPGYSDRQDG